MTTPRSQPVTFYTQTPYVLPSQKYMIPATWRRYQLSQLINKALSLANPVPFDFVIRGEILRTSLEEWCSEHGVGEEETLELEYFESVMPPEKMTEIPHEDWVSSVTGSLRNHFLTASYDGHLRVFDYSKNLVTSSSIHDAPITFATVVPQSSNDEHILVATASHDLTARLARLDLDDSTPKNQRFKTLASLQLHTSPVSSVVSNPSGTRLLTSSWDMLIGLWDTSIPSTDEVEQPDTTVGERRKRRKVDGDKSSDKPKSKAPLSVFKSHIARVSKVSFCDSNSSLEGGDGKKAVSCGFDSTIRTWDIESGVCLHTLSASEKPFLDLALPSHPSANTNAVLATSTDRTLSLFDLQSSSTKTLASFLHPSTPSCVSTNPKSIHQVVTGAYDGIVRVWDLRSTKSSVSSMKVWTGQGAGDVKKVLSVEWRNGVVAVGGEGGFEVWKLKEERES